VPDLTKGQGQGQGQNNDLPQAQAQGQTQVGGRVAKRKTSNAKNTTLSKVSAGYAPTALRDAEGRRVYRKGSGDFVKRKKADGTYAMRRAVYASQRGGNPVEQPEKIQTENQGSFLNRFNPFSRREKSPPPVTNASSNNPGSMPINNSRSVDPISVNPYQILSSPPVTDASTDTQTTSMTPLGHTRIPDQPKSAVKGNGWFSWFTTSPQPPKQ
jgi:hypothetical protein